MIDAVVVTRDSRDLVLECVDRLRSLLLERVIVVDNGSVDGTEDALRAREGVHLVRLDPAQGLAAAYNRGAEAGSAELVLFLNDDIFATAESVDALERSLRERADAVASAGRLVEPEDGRTQVDYQPRPFPTLGSFVATFVGLEAVWPRNPFTGAHRRATFDSSEPVPVEYAAGACLLVRRAAFEAVGRWDERFELWFEDVDLCRRLRDRGPVLYVPTAPFAHVGGHSARRLSRGQTVARHYTGALLYGEKHFGRVRRVGLGLLFAAVAGVRAVTSRRDRELASSYRDVARRAGRLIR